ncbi:MAG: arginine--tRNA ligase [Flavobacteriaceae bacterium]|nr:arginine--tRNA ligase [Flavobacteriaceae bacterium]
MEITTVLKSELSKYLKLKYDIDFKNFEIQQTRKDFEGDLTVVIFPLLKYLKQNPVNIGNELGTFILNNSSLFTGFNVIQGFLNLTVSTSYYLDFLNKCLNNDKYGFHKVRKNSPLYLVEFSSPNTNKPLHLGHIRNILLGFSISKILEASGKRVHKTQIINDRGIHICKSIVAWLKYGNNETPTSSKEKGDFFVGKYYILFDKQYKKEVDELISKGYTKIEAEKNSLIFLEAKELLQKWEAGEQEVLNIWRTMNGWVYDGFEKTYNDLGIDFDSYYYESETYLIGKEIINHGLKKEIFFRKKDNSVWIDLTNDGLDEKILLRSDGTSVYMTQDLGTAFIRHKNNPDMNGLIYTVGNEQDYHFKVLFKILKKLGFDWAENLFHLSYGMVDLPSGKMKSREGTVVDADELILEMSSNASKLSSELGKLDGMTFDEKLVLNRTIGLGALKYHILKVDPKKRILFDPKDSIDFNGNTGPFIQYAYARIQSLIVKSNFKKSTINKETELNDKEKNLLKLIMLYPNIIKSSAENLNPALIANYIYDIVKTFNSYYQSVSILKIEDKSVQNFRLSLSFKIGLIIKSSMQLLGIEVPNKM